MKNDEFYDIVKDTFIACESILRKKGPDYTKGSEDALHNFKEGGAEMGLPPDKVHYIFMKKHWAAVTNFIKTGGQSQSEPIDGRIHDLINYLTLLKAYYIETGQIPGRAEFVPDPKKTYTP